MSLFDRSVRVTVSSPEDRNFFGDGNNAIVIEKLRVRFEVTKTLGKEPNASTIIIDNLSATTRAKFQTKPLIVRLEVGYEDDLKLLYVGDVIWGQSIRAGSNWETHLQLGTGLRAYRHARVNRSFVPGTTALQVLRELATAMNTTLPVDITRDPRFKKQYVSGISVHGKASTYMTKILEPLNMSWSIQDNRLQILSQGQARNSQAFIISQENGMIGVPEFSTPTKKKKKPILNVRSLLYPELYPGGFVQLDTKNLKGNFRVNHVSHMGDTHGQDWVTTVEAKPL